MSLEKQIKEQIKDWERLKRICFQLRKPNSKPEYSILKNKLYEGIKKYYFKYKTSFVINKKPERK